MLEDHLTLPTVYNTMLPSKWPHPPHTEGGHTNLNQEKHKHHLSDTFLSTLSDKKQHGELVVCCVLVQWITR